MAANLGSIVTKVTADSQGMGAGVSKARTDLKKGFDAVKEDAKKAGKEASSGWWDTFKGVLAANAVTGIFGGVMNKVSEANNAIIEMGKNSRKAGTDVGSLQVITEALGGDVATATESIVKLNESLGKAIVEGEDTPFKKLRIDAIEFAALKPVEQLQQVAQAINGLGNSISAQRAGFAIFGDKYKDLAPILEDGGAILGKTAKQLDAFGAAFTESGLKNAKEAAQAFRQVGYLVQGLVNQIGSALNPVIAELADTLGSLSDYGITFKGLKDTIINAAEAIAKAGKYVIEVWSDTKLLQQAWESVFKLLEGGVTKLSGMLANQLGEALSKATGGWMGGKNLGAAQIGAGERAMYKARLGLADIQQKLEDKNAFAGIEKFFGNVRNRMTDTFATAAQWNPFALWMDSLDNLKGGLKTTFDDFLQQATRINKVIDNAIELYGANALDLLGDTATRALGMQVQKLIQSSQLAGPQFAAAVTKGSGEAYTAMITQQFQKRESVQDAIKRIAEEQLREAKIQNQLGVEASRALRELNGKLNVVGIPG